MPNRYQNARFQFSPAHSPGDSNTFSPTHSQHGGNTSQVMFLFIITYLTLTIIIVTYWTDRQFSI